MRKRIGLTGGIASGKSLVHSYFADLGAKLIDYDELARLVVEPGTPALADIVTEFGPQVLTPSGQLDRAHLGSIVFADPAALAKLNSITHPAVRALAKQLDRAAPVGSIVIHEIPLLIETADPASFDAIIVVDVPEVTQVARMQTRDGLTRSEAEARLASQADRARRLQSAHYVIDNSGSPEDTRRQVLAIWNQLTQDSEPVS